MTTPNHQEPFDFEIVSFEENAFCDGQQQFNELEDPEQPDDDKDCDELRYLLGNANFKPISSFHESDNDNDCDTMVAGNDDNSALSLTIDKKVKNTTADKEAGDKGNRVADTSKASMVAEIMQFTDLLKRYYEKVGKQQRKKFLQSQEVLANRLARCIMKTLLGRQDAKPFQRILVILQSCLPHLREGTLVDLRQIYYENVTLFNNDQGNLNKSLSWFLKQTGLTREQLNIRMPVKGLYFGHSIKGGQGEEGEGKGLMMMMMEGTEKIPSDFSALDVSHIDRIIVLEKETMFSQFAQVLKALGQQGILLVTGNK